MHPSRIKLVKRSDLSLNHSCAVLRQRAPFMSLTVDFAGAVLLGNKRTRWNLNEESQLYTLGKNDVLLASDVELTPRVVV